MSKHSIRPIKTDKDHEGALRRIEFIWDAKPGSAEADELEVLSTLVNAYEEQHHPIPSPDPIEALEFRMDQMGHERKDFEAALNIGRGRSSEIFNGRRALSLQLIRKISQVYSISADILIQEPKRRKTRPRPVSSSSRKPVAKTAKRRVQGS